MSQPAHRATRQDINALPEHIIGEILDGELVVSSGFGARHALARSVLKAQLGAAFDRRDGWWIFGRPGVELGDDVIVPDVAGWRRARLPVLPDVEAFTLAPDWVCEVLSPSTTRVDRLKKLPIYHRAGVSHVWLVDPQAMLIEVLRRGPVFWETIAVIGDDKARIDPFDPLDLDVARLWDRGSAHDD